MNTYVAMQAAVSAHCYDATTPNRFSSTEPDFYAHYWTNNAPCYFNSSAGAGTYINFFNTNDYALGKWAIDQNIKPDIGFSFFLGQFWEGTFPTTQLYFPANTYEIFAFCDPAPSYALGAQANVGGAFKILGVSQEVELDVAPYNFTDKHKYHSGEFRSDNAQRWQFWNTVLLKMSFKSNEE